MSNQVAVLERLPSRETMKSLESRAFWKADGLSAVLLIGFLPIVGFTVFLKNHMGFSYIPFWIAVIGMPLGAIMISYFRKPRELEEKEAKISSAEKNFLEALLNALHSSSDIERQQLGHAMTTVENRILYWKFWNQHQKDSQAILDWARGVSSKRPIDFMDYVVRHLSFPALMRRVPTLRDRIHVMTRWMMEAREGKENLAHLLPQALALSMLHHLVVRGGNQQEVLQNLEALEFSMHDIMKEWVKTSRTLQVVSEQAVETNFAREGLKLAMGDVK